MNSWVLLLLLGFVSDIPFLVHEVTADTTSSYVTNHMTVGQDNDTFSQQTTTKTWSSDVPVNKITSEAGSASLAATGSTPITRTNIHTSNIATGSEATTITSDSKEPQTSQETSPTSPSTAEAAQSSKDPKLSENPGLVAVICVFVSVLVIAGVVVLVKICRRREPAFKKLDEVPMGKVSEDSPFARYPPK